MSAISRALAYFNFTLPLDAGVSDVFSITRALNPPRVSGNSRATKGRNHASQKSRANRRKAQVKARNRR